MTEMETKQAIFEFRKAKEDRSGSTALGALADLRQIRDLAKARHLAVALLLEVEPHVLDSFLDKLVWEADLSQRSLVAARYEAGLPQPVVSLLNSGIPSSLETLSLIIEGTRDQPRF